MIARVSVKLGKKIGVAPERSLPLDANPYADWSAHLFTVYHAQYILVTNTVSLYSIVIPGKGMISSDSFLSAVVTHVGESMRMEGHGLFLNGSWRLQWSGWISRSPFTER